MRRNQIKNQATSMILRNKILREKKQEHESEVQIEAVFPRKIMQQRK